MRHELSDFFVYGLFDEGDPSVIRYVGKSTSKSRPVSHFSRASKCIPECSCRSPRKCAWIRGVLSRGGRCGWRVLQRGIDSGAELDACERLWIKTLRPTLTNMTAGGDGWGYGAENPMANPDVKARAAASIRKRYELDPEYRFQNRRPARRLQFREAIKRRYAADPHLGKHFSEMMSRPEVRARADASRGAAWTDEKREALSRRKRVEIASWSDDKRAAWVTRRKATIAAWSPEKRAAVNARLSAAARMRYTSPEQSA